MSEYFDNYTTLENINISILWKLNVSIIIFDCSIIKYKKIKCITYPFILYSQFG